MMEAMSTGEREAEKGNNRSKCKDGEVTGGKQKRIK